MANLQLPALTKSKYSILEMIIQILRANSGVRFTPEQIDMFFNHPEVAQHLNRKNAKDPINSIVWCYKQYHDKEGKFPELGFDGTYFHLVNLKQNSFPRKPAVKSNDINYKFNNGLKTGIKEQKTPQNFEDLEVSSNRSNFHDYLEKSGINYTVIRAEDDLRYQEEQQALRALQESEAIQMGVSLETYIEIQKRKREEIHIAVNVLDKIVQAVYESVNEKLPGEWRCTYLEYDVRIEYEYIKKLISKDKLNTYIIYNGNILKTLSWPGWKVRSFNNPNSIAFQIRREIGFLSKGNM